MPRKFLPSNLNSRFTILRREEEADSLHSTIKKGISVAEDDIDGYVEFLCGGIEQ